MKHKCKGEDFDIMRAYAKHTRREPTPEERDVIKNTFDEDEEYQEAIMKARKRALKRVKEEIKRYE